MLLRDRSHVLGQPPEKLEHQPHGPALTLLGGKTGTWVFCICLHCSELGEGALVNASKLPLFLAATRYLEYVRTHQHSETGKTRRQFLPQQPQDWMLNVQFSPLLRSPRRSLLLWVYCRLYGTAPGVGIIAKGCLRFYYRLQCG